MNFILSDEELKNNGRVSCYYFYSPTLVLHNLLLEKIILMEQKFPKIAFKAINISLFKEMKLRFEIKSFPSLLFFDTKGKIIKIIEGIASILAMEPLIEDIYLRYKLGE